MDYFYRSAVCSFICNKIRQHFPSFTDDQCVGQNDEEMCPKFPQEVSESVHTQVRASWMEISAFSNLKMLPRVLANLDYKKC